MLFWILIIGFALCTTYLMLLPLWQESTEGVAARVVTAPMSLRDDYKIQQMQIEQDYQSGFISAQERKQMQADLARRYISQSKEVHPLRNEEGACAARKGRNAFAVMLLFMMPVISLLIYQHIGSPGYEAVAYDAHRERQHIAQLQERKAHLSGQQQRKQDALQQLSLKKRRLQGEGDNLVAWEDLGIAFMKNEAWGEAIQAFAHLRSKQPKTSRYHALLGEALMRQNQGIVLSEALDAFKRAAELDGDKRAYSDFFIGLAAAQAGNLEQALDYWIVLDQQANPEAPWRAIIRQNIERAAQELGQDSALIFSRLPDYQISETDTQTPDIQAMVSRLDERLLEESGDVEEWLRLAHAFTVLQQPDKSLSRLEQALVHYPENLTLIADWLRKGFLYYTRQGGSIENWSKMRSRSALLLHKKEDIQQQKIQMTVSELLWYQAVAAEQTNQNQLSLDSLQQLKKYIPEGTAQRDLIHKMIAKLHSKLGLN